MHVLNRWIRWAHIYSAAPVMLSMVLFSVTGFFLNHPNMPLGNVHKEQITLELPELLANRNWQTDLPTSSLMLLQWLEKDHGIRGVDLEIEWEPEDKLLIITLEGPNGMKSIEVLTQDRTVEIFIRNLSTLEMLNNVHRGKHVSGIWLFLNDLSAIFMLIFCLTGFWLIMINKANIITASTWISIGTVILVLTIYLMH